ncbi:MAG TPA: tetratricopeptide repeat protein [Pyrinomonadaceae bacterium]
MFLSPGRAAASSRLHLLLHIACAALLVCVPVILARAQGGIDRSGTGGSHRIQGRIYFPSGRRSDATAVKVTLDSTSSERITLIADLNGSFTFQSIAPGSYTITIDAGEEYEIARESLTIEGTSIRARNMSAADIARANVPRLFNVMVSLRLKRGANGGTRPGVLNAALAAVPKPAVEHYEKALESIRAGDSKKAVEQLRAAISYYPEFTIALNELGVQYLHLGQPDRAIEAFRSALRIKPDEFMTRLNYGIALLEKGESTEAEAQLRQALRKNDNSWAAHMYLGVTLINLRRLDEAEKELQRSLALGGDHLSLPHYYLGGIYWARRDYKRAADELEKYLKLSPKAPDAERTRAAIKELRTKQTSKQS